MSGSVDSKAFDTRERECEAQMFGIWVFLASETLIFAASTVVYLILRWQHPTSFAEAAAHMSLPLGTANTAVLLTSSLTMMLADIRASEGRGSARPWLAITALLGIVFLGLKIYEWHLHAAEGLAPFLGWTFRYEGPDPAAAALLFRLYYISTGLHALHLTIGIGLVGGAALLWPRIAAAKRGERAAVFALYWHLIDVVWVFLFAFFYLAGRA